MSAPHEITVLGAGNTRNIRSHDLPIAAVSSGHLYCEPDLFITVDKARYFPKYDATIPAHVPEGQHFEGWNPMEGGHRGDLDLMMLMMTRVIEWSPGWADFDNVCAWKTEWDEMPSFGTDKTIGLGRTMNSMVFAPQVLDRLGYRRLHFAGCDMHEVSYIKAVVGLEWMYEKAKEHGHEWTVTTASSRLARFMPVDTPHGFVPITREKQEEAMVWR